MDSRREEGTEEERPVIGYGNGKPAGGGGSLAPVEASAQGVEGRQCNEITFHHQAKCQLERAELPRRPPPRPGGAADAVGRPCFGPRQGLGLSHPAMAPGLALPDLAAASMAAWIVLAPGEGFRAWDCAMAFNACGYWRCSAKATAR